MFKSYLQQKKTDLQKNEKKSFLQFVENQNCVKKKNSVQYAFRLVRSVPKETLFSDAKKCSAFNWNTFNICNYPQNFCSKKLASVSVLSPSFLRWCKTCWIARNCKEGHYIDNLYCYEMISYIPVYLVISNKGISNYSESRLI